MKHIILALTRFIPDELYLRLAYRSITGKTLHLDPPVTFNEKLQWLKLHNRRLEYTTIVDKYEVRKFVAERVGEKYLVKTLGIWEKVEEIDFDQLPKQFVLKCTHDSGGLVICRDKDALDIMKAKKHLNRCLKMNFFWEGREWPYKNVTPRIYAEEYLEDFGERQLSDYKVFCFDGVPHLIQVDYDRYKVHKRQFFDCDWHRLDISFHFMSDTGKEIQKPCVLDEMLELAKRLSVGFPHLRVDFYIVNDKLYVGEMTFFHGSGFGRWWPEGTDEWLGKFLTIN